MSDSVEYLHKMQERSNLVNNSVDWKAIKAEYIAGGIGYRKLAEKYGVSFGTLSKIAMRENWTDLRKKACEKTGTVLAERIGKRNAKKSAKIDDLADRLLDKMEELVDILIDGRDLKALASALKDLKEVKGIKDKLDVKEQKARIRKLEREANETEDRSKEVVIKIEGGDDSWQG